MPGGVHVAWRWRLRVTFGSVRIVTRDAILDVEAMMMSTAIVDRGRGPEIAGTRITVYDIMDYLQAGWHHTHIAVTLRLSSDEVLTAMRYIEQHTDAVMAGYQRILDRDAAGNPPELRAKLEATHARVQEMLGQRQQAMAKERTRVGTSGRR